MFLLFMPTDSASGFGGGGGGLGGGFSRFNSSSRSDSSGMHASIDRRLIWMVTKKEMNLINRSLNMHVEAVSHDGAEF